jgi:secondary thiamine-phosphate synthase enzyme
VNLYTFSYKTSGENFYDITSSLNLFFQKEVIPNFKPTSGVLHLFLQHTSCALTISEAYDPSAKKDLESFMKHLAPRNLNFITHTLEGPDDSPSHMKSILLQTSLAVPVDKGEIFLGRWQGLYLAEFRDEPKRREILLKFIADNYS